MLDLLLVAASMEGPEKRREEKRREEKRETPQPSPALIQLDVFVLNPEGTPALYGNPMCLKILIAKLTATRVFTPKPENVARAIVKPPAARDRESSKAPTVASNCCTYG